MDSFNTVVPPLTYLHSLPLRHPGDCNLLGVTPDMIIYVEETYGAEGWVAQHALKTDGTMLDTVDEEGGRLTDLQPLELPESIQRPRSGWHTMKLNFGGARHRGMSAVERISDIVHPLSPPEKTLLIDHFDLAIMPPLLLGLAESYVLAEAQLVQPDVYVVCRRLRAAYRLSEPQHDEDKQLYDYDSSILHVAHIHHNSQHAQPPLGEMLQSLPGTVLKRPMDCLIAQKHLFIAEGGHGDEPSQLHIWHIEYPEEEELTEDEKWFRKIYG